MIDDQSKPNGGRDPRDAARVPYNMSLLREPPFCDRPRDRTSARRRRVFLAILIALALGGPPALAQSSPEGKEKIQGKPKPSEKSQASSRAAAPKAPPVVAAPARSAPVARSPAQPSQRAAFPPPDLSKPPPMLPVASREKMRACAEEWSKLKVEQKEPLPLWRDFANKCLTR